MWLLTSLHEMIGTQLCMGGEHAAILLGSDAENGAPVFCGQSY